MRLPSASVAPSATSLLLYHLTSFPLQMNQLTSPWSQLHLWKQAHNTQISICNPIRAVFLALLRTWSWAVKWAGKPITSWKHLNICNVTLLKHHLLKWTKSPQCQLLEDELCVSSPMNSFLRDGLMLIFHHLPGPVELATLMGDPQDEMPTDLCSSWAPVAFGTSGAGLLQWTLCTPASRASVMVPSLLEDFPKSVNQSVSISSEVSNTQLKANRLFKS